MTRTLRVEPRPDLDALLAREILTVSAILAAAIAALALIHRFA